LIFLHVITNEKEVNRMNVSNSGLADETASEEDSMDSPEEEPKPQFQLHIATDRMTAYLRVKPAYPGQKVSFEEICDFLQQNKVVYGICEDEIHAFCDEERFYTELICAKGIPSVDGIDGLIEYKFDTEKGLKPKDRGDGTVDFRDLGFVKNISKGGVLCQIIPPAAGEDGVDIYQDVIPSRPGRLPVLPGGSNTAISEDGLSLLATVDGCIEYLKYSINVNDVLTVHGDVDGASGNIDSVGSVIVEGDVREGFFVKSEHDISIYGMAEGAIIEAKGTISISDGMNGMGRGTLKAGGNIVGKYFENAILISDHDIYADVLMNSRATAGGSIILKGRKASLIGGSYQVGKRIFAKNIGTMNNTVTRVSIESVVLSSMLEVDKELDDLEELNTKLLEAQNELNDYQGKFSVLTKQISLSGQRNSEDGNRMIKAAIFKKGQLAEAVNQIKKQISKAKEKTASLIDFNITGLGIVYPGTKMTIGPFTMNIQNENSNMKFYADQEHIVVGLVLPSDIV
jgi:uncharacterized protein